MHGVNRTTASHHSEDIYAFIFGLFEGVINSEYATSKDLMIE
jgi:hypothetical protein